MPRKKKISEDEYNEILPTRLRLLIDEKKCRQEDIALRLGTTRQAVSNYINGQTRPDWKYVAALAEYFGVSADYLLGLSDDRNRLPCAADDLKLNEKTIGFLKGLNNASKFALESIIDKAGGDFTILLMDLLSAQSSCKNVAELYNDLLSDEKKAEDIEDKIAHERYRIKKELGSYASLVHFDRHVKLLIYEVENGFNAIVEKVTNYPNVKKLSQEYDCKSASELSLAFETLSTNEVD